MRKIIALALLCAAATAHAEPLYVDEVQKWRADHEASYRSDDGWLTIAGLFWLKPGANSFGAGKHNDLVFPTGPQHDGVLTMKNGKITLAADKDAGIRDAKGNPVTTATLATDEKGKPDVLTLGSLRFFIIKRGTRWAVRLRDLDNPARKDFKGFQWFPIDTVYRVKAEFVVPPEPVTIHVPTVTGETIDMVSPGRAVFELDGKRISLDAVRESPEDTELFWIFSDTTNGKETYGGGRFMYSPLPKDGQVTLDFNESYSPPCAVTSFATCPLPPPGNRLDVAIKAGQLASGHP
jgi:uncharacterized protein (DUF1684 family)